MEQITMDEFVNINSQKQLICCSLTDNYHWLRISEGDTPAEFRDEVSFVLHDFDYLYVRTAKKDKILKAFDGVVTVVPFEFNKG